MTSFFQQPRATCPVLRKPPGELEPWTAHMVSMMQALQSGARLTFYPGRVTWSTPDGATLGFNNRQHLTQLRLRLALLRGMDPGRGGQVLPGEHGLNAKRETLKSPTQTRRIMKARRTPIGPARAEA